MKNKKIIITVSCLLLFFAREACAETDGENRVSLPVFTISSSHNVFQWNDSSYDYRLNTGEGERAPIEMSSAETEVPLSADQQTLRTGVAENDDGEDYAEKILDKIPYSK
ncbi:MAG: hypothetical protein KDI11_09895, partial [Alphaproteobacteria bacterium]|nr:hypothetical protein [Alphaproteobacteria bacterium]